MKEEDRDLMNRLQALDSKDRAFEELVRTYQKPLYAHIRRMIGNHEDADDVLQNTFVQVWRHIGSFKGDAALYTWIYRIATNESLGFLRKRKPTQAFQSETHQATSTDGPNGDEISMKLNDALRTLPDKQRQVFDMKYFSEMKYEEIADITGTSVGALKASYFHAVKKIEAYIKA